jgi:hypothetical protein
VTWSDDDLAGLDLAIDEATLAGIDVDVDQRAVSIGLEVLRLPEEGDQGSENVPAVHLVLHPVHRVVASLRHGRWNDENARVEPFEIDDLREVAMGMAGHPIYGREFFDGSDERRFARWRTRLSLDWSPGVPGDAIHTLDVFQERDEPAAILDLRVWFDRLTIVDYWTDEVVPLEDFIAGGRRWWDALYAHDPRTYSSGIVPGDEEGMRIFRQWLRRNRSE